MYTPCLRGSIHHTHIMSKVAQCSTVLHSSIKEPQKEKCSQILTYMTPYNKQMGEMGKKSSLDLWLGTYLQQEQKNKVSTLPKQSIRWLTVLASTHQLNSRSNPHYPTRSSYNDCGPGQHPLLPIFNRNAGNRAA